MINQEELIWNYLDGQLEAGDRARVEAALKADEAFREQFLQSQLMHQNLGRMEAEVPSMRFAQNVMDSLPTVKELATGPLVSVRWLRTFFGGTIALLIAIFGSSAALAPQSTSTTQDPQVERLIDTVYSIFEFVPANTLFMAGIIMISLFILLSLDRWLQKRFQRS